ncbi:MAG: flagellar biosynthetic protein FliR [Deltaproteobacteria bacterium]|nr:flagellar biosynthetic protein FliR [Deltaproteobacteria bacterium]
MLPPIDELSAVGLAWARVMPTITIVPAFGLRALPTPARGVLALAIAAGIYPALVPVVTSHRSSPWLVLALEQVVLGLPVALAAAIPLWAATMAGGIVDVLRGSPEGAGLATVEGRPSSFGVLLSLFASAVFLGTGGAARTAAALAAYQLPSHPLLAAAHDIVAGVGLAVSIGGPLLAAAVVLELTFAMIARAASPAQIHALLAPLRALGLLAVVAIVMERLASLVATSVRAAL